MKLAAKNALENGLIPIRKRINGLSKFARFHTYDEVSAQLIWLEIDVRKLIDEVAAAQNQEALPIDETSSKNAG